MTLDDALVNPVNHYIVGHSILLAFGLHSDAKVLGNLAELQEDIETCKGRCITICDDMIANPGDYVKQESYRLKSEDMAFLQGLSDKAKTCDWMDSAQVEELSDYVAEYVPKNPVEEGKRTS